LIVNDLLAVLYAPHKAFKKIIEKPKYLGVAIVLLLFVAIQTGYYFSYYSKINYEQTFPSVQGVDQLNAWTTTNATAWTITQGATVNQDFTDFINETYLGNSSLQFSISNSNNMSMALNGFGSSVNLGQNGFHNLSMRIKFVQPNVAPKNAILTLYSSSGTSSYFKYDLTSQVSSSSVGQWNNLTIPVGTSDWQSTGSANWSDVTGIKLDLTYPSVSGITVRMQGLFFRGEYLTVLQGSGPALFAASAIESTLIQFLFQWLVLTAVVYLILKVLKAPAFVWKPLFIATGIVLIVMVITSLIGLIATFTLPTVYYPYEFPPAASLIYPDFYVASASVQSQAIYNAIVASTAVFTSISTAVTVILYAWQVILVTMAVRAISGFSYGKSIAAAIGSVILTIVILGLLASIGLI
jgi:hypothetical protein